MPCAASEAGEAGEREAGARGRQLWLSQDTQTTAARTTAATTTRKPGVQVWYFNIHNVVLLIYMLKKWKLHFLVFWNDRNEDKIIFRMKFFGVLAVILAIAILEAESNAILVLCPFYDGCDVQAGACPRGGLSRITRVTRRLPSTWPWSGTATPATSRWRSVRRANICRQTDTQTGELWLIIQTTRRLINFANSEIGYGLHL